MVPRVGRSVGSRRSLRNRRLLSGYWPVSSAARHGVHTGMLETAVSNTTPSAAIRSMTGVCTCAPRNPGGARTMLIGEHEDDVGTMFFVVGLQVRLLPSCR